MSETPDSCPREECDADIVKTETVVTCTEGHQRVM
ncbi:hypothetical protein BDK61_4403 [Haloarcula quadrata]|uniref:Uncharacterized protein n=1 Tax=Haloarcula quadrata TaxID=182779 RepID=A0A495QR81_9EURY|nr:hypothetical protein BDK61_4403 [Haloarcula quadrata]